jgi:uncharacterized membrane protein YkvA (DUF1232 family)
MSDIAVFMDRGAAQITPRILAGIHKKLPFLKLEFAQINDPKHPHLVNQLEFLADVVEDFADGADAELPLVAVAAAAYALVYAHRQFDLIPDHVQDIGHSDDSAVVRAVLMRHERAFANYAERHQMSWSRITVNP